MARDAVRAVRQQPRESVSTLETSIRTAGENPSRENIQGLGRLAGDIKRLGNAHGAVDAATQNYDAKVTTAGEKRDTKVNKAQRKFGRKTEKAASARDNETRGVRGYLGQDRAGGSSGGRDQGGR
ncbi:MAG: hypothetical protein GEV07_18980 [Streptosporangiales bacterium]|nr:hypothetical protein [Streptosporangiales bacterium]